MLTDKLESDSSTSPDHNKCTFSHINKITMGITQMILVIGMCGDPELDLSCVKLASYMERSPLMWMMLLHLHVNLNGDDDDDNSLKPLSQE